MRLTFEEASALLLRLRRYARAAVETQMLAERAMEAALHQLLDEMERGPPADTPPRLLLFRAFHDQLRVAEASAPALEAALGPLAQRAQAALTEEALPEALARQWLRRRLQGLPAQRRQALLLHHLEGFGTEEVGWVLRRGAGWVGRALSASWTGLRVAAGAEVVILEDEAVTALDLALLMRELGHQVRGIASTPREAELLLAGPPPDLILSDLQPRGIWLTPPPRVPIVYVTARPEAAPRPLRGEGPLRHTEAGAPVLVVAKPFSVSRLSMAVYDVLAAAARQRPAG
ncbi:sigma factor-like helix-turn-helix DNA-binding protein [Pseudoroseomonas cervicalis]|uniref:sigma factor-like helix-turn-helix DNA-binding protein n=1 Tax=Teichococcus cervicalis TaxID=204525 RepID=UPI0027D80270|nr:sigma factor-like helix-turn-helix DNA-binding protein [Pseudoroseomonas cervicalis]